jgi:hypothetical protein
MQTIWFTSLATIISNFISFATNILVGVFILGAWLYIANFIESIVKSSSDSKTLALAVKVIVIVLTSFMGLQQMGIGWDIINQAFTLSMWAIAVAFALAVWLGSKDIAWKEIEELLKKLKK